VQYLHNSCSHANHRLYDLCVIRRTTIPDNLRQLLNYSRYAVIATTCPDGTPWNSPVAAAFDDGLNMYWGSAYDSRHSRNIAARPEIFVVVFAGERSVHEGSGIYLQMRARELSTSAEVKAARRHYDASFFEDRHPGITFLGDCPTRLYMATVLRGWHNYDAMHDGYFVDRRRSLDNNGASR